MDDEDNLREQIWKLVFRATQDETGDFDVTDCANEIMKLVDDYVTEISIERYEAGANSGW